MDFALYQSKFYDILQIRQLNVNKKRLIIAVQNTDTDNYHHIKHCIELIICEVFDVYQSGVDLLINNKYIREVTGLLDDDYIKTSTTPHGLLNILTDNLPKENICLLLFLNITNEYLQHGFIAFNNAVDNLNMAIIRNNIDVNMVIYNQHDNYDKFMNTLNLITPCSTIGKFNKVIIDHVLSFIKNEYLYAVDKTIVATVKLITHNIYFVLIKNTSIVKINRQILDLNTVPIQKLNGLIAVIGDLLVVRGRVIQKLVNEKTEQMIAQTGNNISKLRRIQNSIIPKTIAMADIRKHLTNKLNEIIKEYKQINQDGVYISRNILTLTGCSSSKYAVMIRDYVETLDKNKLIKICDNQEFNCFLSLEQLSDVILNNDVLCLGMLVPVECRDKYLPPVYISPNYISLSAFKAAKPGTIIDGNRQLIRTCVMLYINPVHWQLTKYYSKGIQFDTLYMFVILYKCLENHVNKPSEFTLKQVNLILDICLQFYKIYAAKYHKLIKQFNRARYRSSPYVYVGLIYTYYEYKKRTYKQYAPVINTEKIIWNTLSCVLSQNKFNWLNVFGIRHIINTIKLPMLSNGMRVYNFADLKQHETVLMDIISSVKYCKYDNILDTTIKIFKSNLNPAHFIDNAINLAATVVRPFYRLPAPLWKSEFNSYNYVLRFINYLIITNIDRYENVFYFTKRKYLSLIQNNPELIDTIIPRDNNEIKIVVQILEHPVCKPLIMLRLINLLQRHNCISEKKMKRIINKHLPKIYM